jgi:hypothetical protein
MRACLVLSAVTLLAAPLPAAAQLSRADSLRIVTALAPAVRTMFRGQAVSQDNASLLRSGAPWNALLQNALNAFDSTSITQRPLVTTARLNVFSAEAAGDSITLNVGVTQCDGARFAGGGEFYVLQRSGNAWRIRSRRFSGSGHGTCGQLPTGYHQSQAVPLPDSLRESRLLGRFRIHIERPTADSGEQRALLIAESITPDSASIGRVAQSATLHTANERRADSAKESSDRWWFSEFDGVRIPFAVTGAAVDYYIQRIRERSNQQNPFSASSRGNEHRGNLAYRARVTKVAASATAPGGYLVRMDLEWSYYCGPRCALRFNHWREVSIAPDGRVISVRGDGPPSVMVS